METTDTQPRSALPHNSTPGSAPLARAMSLVLLLISALVILATVYHANRLRTENLTNHRIFAEGLARIGEREVTQTLQSIDRLLGARLDDWIATEDVDASGFGKLLARDLTGLPAARTLSIVSGTGHIAADSSGKSIDRPLAQGALDELRGTTEGPTVIISRPWRGHDLGDGEPTHDRIDTSHSAYFFTMSRKDDRNGSNTLAVATINPDAFSGFLSSVAGRPEYVIELYRYDGTLLMSTRPQSNMPGSSETSQPIFSHLLPDNEIGVVDDPNGGDPQMIAYRSSRQYPLVIEVRVSHDQALSGWRTEIRNLSVVAGLSLLLIGLVASLLHRYNRRRGVEQERARQANELAARVFEASYDGIFITDSMQRIVRVNGSFSGITGYTGAEVAGQTPCMLIADIHQGTFCDALREQVALHGEWHGELTAKRKDGSLYCGRLAIGTVRDRTGATSNYIGTFIDISEVKEHEAALRKAKEAAEAASLAKSQFLATMSHELRTPMNAILGMAQLQLLPGNTEAENQQYAGTIVDAGNTLLALLNDILDLAKVEAGGLELVDGIIEPQQILTEVGNLFSHSARGKGLQLEVCWNAPGERQYRGDAIRLRQILGNLINNAIKFTDKGSISVTGGECVLPDGTPGLRFDVIDTGIGISQAQQAALFQPFSQVDASATRRFGGTGLGLSIVRKLAELMGGEAGVVSEEARGSRFWFTIRANGALHTRVDDQPERSADPSAPGGIPILVVEDDPVNRALMELMLKKMGYRVSSAGNGKDALALLESSGVPPAVILMDCHMPVMDGLEATRRIREREVAAGTPRIPVIAVTAQVFEDSRLSCVQAGMDDFLEKPINLERLRGTLARHTGQADRHPAAA